MRRNKRRHGEQTVTLQQAVIWARDTAVDLWNLLEPVGQQGRVQQMPRWKPLDPGCLKLNTDAAFYADQGSGATACIIRNHHGEFIHAQAIWHGNLIDAGMGEPLACRDAVRLARHLGLQRVQVETDCLELVQLSEKKELHPSLLDPVLTEINELKLAFSEFVFKFVSRSCNKIAHVLAKQVTHTNQSEVWHETPTCVRDLMLSEAQAVQI
jgi:ribonuclease HI